MLCPALVSNLFAADFSVDNEYVPLIFSFSINPVTSPVYLRSLSDNSDSGQPAFANTGVMLNSAVKSIGMQGGLSFYSGKGSATSALDNFSTNYAFNGWNSFDNILVYPNESSTTSGADFLGQKHVDDRLQAVSLYGGYDLTPSVKIKGAFLISKTQKNNELTNLSTLSNDSSYSWWLDFGGDYKFNEQMTYKVNFGYYDSDQIINDSGGAEMLKGSVYLFNTQLNMSF